ncbi:ruvA N terminal domain protein, partial [Chlamydia psittaci 84-8471/1]
PGSCVNSRNSSYCSKEEFTRFEQELDFPGDSGIISSTIYYMLFKEIIYTWNKRYQLSNLILLVRLILVRLLLSLKNQDFA